MAGNVRLLIPAVTLLFQRCHRRADACRTQGVVIAGSTYPHGGGGSRRRDRSSSHQARAETLLPPLGRDFAARFAEADPRVPANVSVVSGEEKSPRPSSVALICSRSRAEHRHPALYGASGHRCSRRCAAAALAMPAAATSSSCSTAAVWIRSTPAGISWSAIPLGNVERIEIIRGGGTVLYGDRATGGVINIVTRQVVGPRHIGLRDDRQRSYTGIGDAAAAFRPGCLSFGFRSLCTDTDGWRRSNQASQRSSSADAAASASAPAGEDSSAILLYRDLPAGYVTAANYARNPASRTPKTRSSAVATWSGRAQQDISDPSKPGSPPIMRDYRGDNVSFGSVFKRHHTPSFTAEAALGPWTQQPVEPR